VTVVATLAPALTLAKTAVAGDPYNQVGAVVDYQYLVTNVGNVTIDAVSVTDDRIASVQCPQVALASQASVMCTGRYTITQADLDAGTVTNHATAMGTPATGTLPPATASATVRATATPMLAMVKSIVSGDPYDTLGDVIDYRYVVRNTGNVTIDALSVADDRIADVQCPATTLAPQATVACSARYTVTQADLDAGAVTNIATATGRPATGTLVPATATATAGALARVTYAKQVDATDPVGAGDVLAYTLTVTIAQSATTQATTLTDTPGPGLRFRSVTSPGAFACNDAAPLVCTLPAGTAPGTYAMTYTATVGDDASRVVRNTVTAASAPGDPHPPTCADSCTTETTVREPRIVVTKTATPGTDTEVVVDQVIAYTLTVIVRDAATRTDLVLHDIPDPGLTLGPLPAGCVPSGASIACTLPAGTPAGVHTFAYTATVNAHAGATVGNQVLIVRPLNVNPLPLCLNCAIEHHVGATELRLSKQAAVREAKIGDLVRYTLTVDNIGSGQLTDGIVVDTPPPGFIYVDGSLRAADANGRADVVAGSPLRFTGVDIAPGGSATLVYLLRVGAACVPARKPTMRRSSRPTATCPSPTKRRPK
jgi:uncharacterized repeat protein (TIGR01451 family)